MLGADLPPRFEREAHSRAAEFVYGVVLGAGAGTWRNCCASVSLWRLSFGSGSMAASRTYILAKTERWGLYFRSPAILAFLRRACDVLGAERFGPQQVRPRMDLRRLAGVIAQRVGEILSSERLGPVLGVREYQPQPSVGGGIDGLAPEHILLAHIFREVSALRPGLRHQIN